MIYSTTTTTTTGGVVARWRVGRSVWQYMLAIALAYFVTLCLYPGIVTEVVSCRMGSWMPVVMMATFNLFDFIGKVGWIGVIIVIVIVIVIIIITIIIIITVIFSPAFLPSFLHPNRF